MKNLKIRNKYDIYGTLEIALMQEINAISEFDAMIKSECQLNEYSPYSIKFSITTKCGEIILLSIHDWNIEISSIIHSPKIGFIDTFFVKKQLTLCFSYSYKANNEMEALFMSNSLLSINNIHETSVVINYTNGETLHPIVHLENILVEEIFSNEMAV